MSARSKASARLLPNAAQTEVDDRGRRRHRGSRFEGLAVGTDRQSRPHALAQQRAVFSLGTSICAEADESSRTIPRRRCGQVPYLAVGKIRFMPVGRDPRLSRRRPRQIRPCSPGQARIREWFSGNPVGFPSRTSAPAPSHAASVGRGAPPIRRRGKLEGLGTPERIALKAPPAEGRGAAMVIITATARVSDR